MKKLLIGLSVLSLLLLSGCAPSSSPEPKAPSTKYTQTKLFKTDKKYADIYLCRNSFMGSIWDFPIIVDGKQLGETTAYCHFHWKMKPGKHIIQSKADNTFTLELNTKSNTNYFIIQETKMGMMKAGAELRIVDEEEGKKCVLATKMLKSQLHMSEYIRKIA